MMMSSLSAPDLDLAKEQLSIDLQQAQTLVLTDPARCAQIATSFLERTANNPSRSSATVRFGYREPMLNYGTATQTTGAICSRGVSCSSRAVRPGTGVLRAGHRHGRERAAVRAAGPWASICWSEAATCNSIPMAPRPLLDKLDKLLANPDLKESQLQVYSRLLRVNASIESGNSIRQAAAGRDPQMGGSRQTPSGQAWTSAVAGSLSGSGSAPACTGEYIEAQQQAKPCRILFLGLLSNRWSASIRKSRSHKSAAIRQRGGQLFSCPRQFSMLSDALIVLARLNRDQGEMNMALVYFFNALDLLDEAATAPASPTSSSR